jgi:DNA-binding NtrC family response regulator
MIASRLEPTTNRERFIGDSDPMRRVFQAIHRVSRTNVTVLVRGESGTGKELVAAEVHRCSARSDGPWVAVNCGAIPESLVDSELFGHERGAFTDAKERRRGCFELAHKGTLFLDEVCELACSSQVRLLRALDGRPVTPVGGEKPLPLDVRIVAATNRDVEAEVRAGSFREDLFWRLNVFTIELPPLRDRREDIPALIDHFVELAAEEHNLPRSRPDADALAALISYRWPGNVRELRSVIESALIHSEGGVITRSHLPVRIQVQTAPGRNGSNGKSPCTTKRNLTLPDAVERAQFAVEAKMIQDALAATEGNRTQAAERLGITRRTLFNKLRDLGIGNGQNGNGR